MAFRDCGYYSTIKADRDRLVILKTSDKHTLTLRVSAGQLVRSIRKLNIHIARAVRYTAAHRFGDIPWYTTAYNKS
jgi:hypothetical protein